MSPTLNAIIGACILLLLALVVLLVLLYVQPQWFIRWIVRRSHRSVLWCGQTTSKVCALTIDDAPSDVTPFLLDVLKEHGVRATFFIISGNIAGHEETMRRIVREGHTLGNHLTKDRASILDDLHVFEQHVIECDRAIGVFQAPAAQPKTPPKPAPAPAQLDQEQVAALDEHAPDASDPASMLLKEASSEVDAAKQPIRHSKWLRPGSGWFTSRMREVAARHGYRLCMGSVYPHDAQIKWEGVNALHLETHTRAGSVLIVHNRPWTVGVLRRALPVLTKQFKFVSLDTMASLNQ